MPRQRLNFSLRALGSYSKLLSRARWHQVGLLEHQCDCGGEKGQEGAGVEATSATETWRWKPTHLGGAGVASKNTGSLDPLLPCSYSEGGSSRLPFPNCYHPHPCSGPGPAPAPAANPGDTGPRGRGRAAGQLASISWGAGSGQCH